MPITLPVTPNKVRMAIFIPFVMGASGAPKQVAHAERLSINRIIVTKVSIIILFTDNSILCTSLEN
jgi:hypothetical protein